MRSWEPGGHPGTALGKGVIFSGSAQDHELKVDL